MRRRDQGTEMKVLHVGCGGGEIDPWFKLNGWEEIRYDIDRSCKPDIVGSMLDMRQVQSQSMDAIYNSHSLEHLHAHEVPWALKEFKRVLKPSGFAVILVPDIQALGEKIGKGELEDTLYVSPAGPISVCDVLWGHRPSLATGNQFMAHKFGFTKDSLSKRLLEAGFSSVNTKRIPVYQLLSKAYVSK